MLLRNKQCTKLAVALACCVAQSAHAFMPLAVVNKAFGDKTSSSSSRQYLYLAEDAEAVPTSVKMRVPTSDKGLSAEEAWRAASLNVPAADASTSSTAVIDENDDTTSLSSAQVKYEAISQNLDAAMDDIADYEMEMTASPVVEQEEELVVRESRLASEYYNDDDDDSDDDDDDSATEEAVDSIPQDQEYAFAARPTFVISRNKKESSDPNQECSHEDQDNEVPHFATVEDVLKLKEQPNDFIVENAVSHFAKAAESAGRAAFLTFGAMFKAATSEDVAESANEASSTVSAAVQSISDAIDNDSKKSDASSAYAPQSIADAVSEGFETVAGSIGAVGGAFLRNFESTPESSEAFEAATESTKECVSLFASMVAFGMKQGERVVGLKDGETVASKEPAMHIEEPAAANGMSLDDINMRVEMPNFSVEKNRTPRRKEMTANEMTEALKNMVGEHVAVEKNPMEQVATKKVSLDDINTRVELAMEKVLSAMRRE